MTTWSRLARTQSAVRRPAVDRARGVEHCLGDRRVRMDDPGQLLRATLERHRVDELGDHVAGPVADDVGADDLAELGVDDELDQAVTVVVDGPGADRAELEAA